MNGHTKYQVVPTSLQKWIIIISVIFRVFSHFQSLLFLQNRNTSVKIDYGNFKLDLSRKFFDSQAVLSVTGCIECIVFKWVENANPIGPRGECFTEVLKSEQILKIWKIKL